MSPAPKLTFTKIILGSSALLLALGGLSMTFFPQELSGWFGLPDEPAVALLSQIIGALYFGFAMMNWMSKSGLIGGVYKRPIVIANMAHFMMVGITLLKYAITQKQLPESLWLLTVTYLVYAALYSFLLFRTPPQVKTTPG
jgi:Fe2+ transport system protein B